MAEVRIDPLSGLRTLLVAADGGREGGDPLASGRGQPDLFAARPAGEVREEIELGGALLEAGAEGLGTWMETWRERMRAWAADAAYVHVGVAASPGEPAFAELWALPFVPATIARERERATAYHDRTQGRTLGADLLQEEVKRRERLVSVGSEAVAVCAWAPLADHHVQVLPRAARARFEDDGPLGAATVWDALARIAAVRGEPAVDLWVRTAPPGASTFCWRIDIVPRPAAGSSQALALGAGVPACSLTPEQSAAVLREATP